MTDILAFMIRRNVLFQRNNIVLIYERRVIGQDRYYIRKKEVNKLAVEPIKVVGRIILSDGTTKALEELTKEELGRVNNSMSERLGRVMSSYYHNHPEAYKLL